MIIPAFLTHTYLSSTESKAMATVLTIVYVALGILGSVIILLFLGCIVQKLFSKKPKEYYVSHL